MKRAEFLRRRLASSLLTGARPATATEVVTHVLALQAQDYGQSLWAVGSRTAQPSRAAVEAEIAAGLLVRTWPMRGTLHLVRPTDVRWMLDLCAARAAQAATGRHRQLGLTDRDLGRAGEVVAAELEGGPKTRAELFAALAAGGVSPAGQRGVHILGHLAHRGLLVVGARIGRQPGFTLLTTPPSTLSRAEGLAEIARRYVRGHGPASARDLAWWTGLTLADARRGFAAVAAEHELVDLDGETYAYRPAPLPPRSAAPMLLAGFDEHVLAYADRSPVLGEVPIERILPGRNGVFLPTVITGGRVTGTWRTATGEVTPSAGPVDVGPAWRRYQRFLGGDASRAGRSRR